MLPLSGADHFASHFGGVPAVHLDPSTVFWSRTRVPSAVDTTLARHRCTVVLPPSYDVGSVQAGTPATPVLTEVLTPARGRIVTGAPCAAETSTRTVRAGRVTRVVWGK